MKLILALLLIAFGANAQQLSNWSQTAANNNSAAPNGWPVGMNPSDVKLSGRQMMAAVRTWYDDAQWINPGLGITYASPTAFIVGDSNSGIYHLNRRIRTTDGVGYVYGTIVSTSYNAPSTTIIIAPDSGTISNSLSAVSYGAVSAQNSSITSATVGLSNLSLDTDTITSGTTSVVVYSSASTVSVTVGGVTGAYFNSSGLAVSGTVSASTISGTFGNFGTVSATTSNVGTVSTTGALGNVSATYGYFSQISATTGIAFKTFAQSADTSISAGGTINVTHGCGAAPRLAYVEIVNTSAELGFSVGQVVPVPPYGYQGSNLGYVIASDATSSTLKIGTAATPFSVIRLDTGANAAITNANWNVRLKTACQ